MSTLDTSARNSIVSRLRAAAASEPDADPDRHRQAHQQATDLGRAAALAWVASDRATRRQIVACTSYTKPRSPNAMPVPYDRLRKLGLPDDWQAIAGPHADCEAFIAAFKDTVAAVWDDIKAEVDQK